MRRFIVALLYSGLFQSAPGREAGRCRGSDMARDCHAGFNPRPAVRPGDAVRRSTSSALVMGFNPRPAVRPGDAQNGFHLTPPFRCFNPRPAVRPGDAYACQFNGPYGGGFQSAPGREAGRCSRQAAGCRVCRRFNPRPAVRPGDALYEGDEEQFIRVSIRARP